MRRFTKYIQRKLKKVSIFIKWLWYKNFIAKKYRYIQAKKLIKKIGIKGKQIRIIIGAESIRYPNWIPTEEYFLDILKKEDFKNLLQDFQADAMLAEHVWEHLTLEDGLRAAQNCFLFLKNNGYLRIAVPDGFHPDPGYIERVKVGALKAGDNDHKVLYNYQNFKKIFEAAGFKIKLLEHFDENRIFHKNSWNPEDGFVERSDQFDARNKDGKRNYTSIILDAIKP